MNSKPRTQLQFELAEARRAKLDGRLHVHARFPSKLIPTRRDLIVYVPPDYPQGRNRYPVCYMQDGQNLFDPATAFGGQDWRVDVTADAMAECGETEAPIIVGVYNAGEKRIVEYTPTRDRLHRKDGRADRYAEMLVREIKPFIDHEYRTLKTAPDTAIAGSSLGALAALVAVLDYPQVFGNAAALSPSVWWDERAILRRLDQFRSKARPRLWVDTGTQEGNNPQQSIADCRALREALLHKGWCEGENLRYVEIEGGTHSEGAWAARFGAVLAFLFPKR